MANYSLTELERLYGASVGPTMIGLGRVPTLRLGNVIGKNTDVDNSTLPEDVWTGGGTYPFPATAGPVSLVSTSAADTSAGTGLRTVRVIGLDTAYGEIQEDVVLNGTTPVPTLQSFLRVNDLRGLTAGSGNENAGTVTGSIAGDVVAHMLPGAGRAQQTVFTVPLGHTALVVFTAFGIQRTQDAFVEFEIVTRSPGAPLVVRNTTTVSAASPWPSPIITPVPVPILERTDVRARVTATSASASNLVVTCNIQYLLAKLGDL